MIVFHFSIVEHHAVPRHESRYTGSPSPSSLETRNIVLNEYSFSPAIYLITSKLLLSKPLLNQLAAGARQVNRHALFFLPFFQKNGHHALGSRTKLQSPVFDLQLQRCVKPGDVDFTANLKSDLRCRLEHVLGIWPILKFFCP